MREVKAYNLDSDVIKWAKDTGINNDRSASYIVNRALRSVMNNSKAPVKSKPVKSASTRFTPPTVEEVFNYCNERCNNVDAQKFVDHYIGNGWVRGKTKIKDWRACVRTWEKGSKEKGAQQFSDVTLQNIKNGQEFLNE